MLIKSNKDRLDVEISIRNRKDNAYNTKVILSFSSNINYVKAEVSRWEFCQRNSTVSWFHFLCSNMSFPFLIWFVW